MMMTSRSAWTRVLTAHSTRERVDDVDVVVDDRHELRSERRGEEREREVAGLGRVALLDRDDDVVACRAAGGDVDRHDLGRDLRAPRARPSRRRPACIIQWFSVIGMPVSVFW